MEVSTETPKEAYKGKRNVFLTLYFVIAFIERILAMSLNNNGALTPTSATVFNVVVIIILWIISISICYFWTKYKGLNRMLTLLGVIPIIGFIVLALMRDKNI